MSLGAALAFIVPVLSLGLAHRHGETLGELGLAIAAASLIVGIYMGFLRPRRRWQDDSSVARYVGAREERISSDLLSSVDFASASPDATAHVSNALIDELIRDTASRVQELEVRDLVSVEALRRAKRVAGLTVIVYALALAAIPDTLARGWDRVLHPPTPGPFGDAAMSDAPLVGDIEITLIYPAYTKRIPVRLPASSGDFRAMPGTHVTIDTRALAPASSAQIVFGEPDEDVREPTDMVVKGSQLTVRFVVNEASLYRFTLTDRQGRQQVEATPHKIEITKDRAPEVKLYAPADELDVTSMKRVELAYTSDDDYGIAKVELVYTEQGGKPKRKQLPLAEPGRRSAQAKWVWDLADLSLRAGTRLEYHVEVSDNDTVSGPNVGKSRSFFLRVFSPREKHEGLTNRQERLFEKMVQVLGSRLTAEPKDYAAHVHMNRATSQLVVEIGGLLAALKDDKLAARDLQTALRNMRKRLDKLARAERGNLTRMSKSATTGLEPRHRALLASGDKRSILELEPDVLLLANWIDRQRVENLLSINDEIKTHQDRIKELFKELARTGSDAVRKEIERELKALEQKLAELAAKRGRIAADVLDRFMNTEAMKGDKAKSCMDEVRALLGAGKHADAQKKMQECTQSLDDAAKAMEQALSSLRSDKFTEQERKFGKMMNSLADLAQDQRDIARRADDIWDRYAKRADDMMRDKAKATRKKLSKTIEKLKKRLADVPKNGLTPFGKEELGIVKNRIKDVDQMLADGDIAEALAMARQARAGLETVESELDAALDEDKHAPWRGATEKARKAVRKAAPLARKLVKELEASTPSPKEIMSAKDRRALEKLRRRQRKVQKRTKRLAKKASEAAKDLPGKAGKRLAKGMGEAAQQMGRAGRRMQARDPSGAKQEARGAADKLEQTRKDAQGAARRQQQGRAGRRDEPIRIPGADQYKAPEKFREQLLEAMKKEKAPKGFGALVRRYYEELIR